MRDATKTRSLVFHVTWQIDLIVCLLLLVIQINQRKQCFSSADSAVALLDQMRKLWGKSWITVFHIHFQSEPSAVGAKLQLVFRQSDWTAHSGCFALWCWTPYQHSPVWSSSTVVLQPAVQQAPFNNEVGCVISCGREIICRRLWLWGLSGASLLISKNVSACVPVCTSPHFRTSQSVHTLLSAREFHTAAVAHKPD